MRSIKWHSFALGGHVYDPSKKWRKKQGCIPGPHERSILEEGGREPGTAEFRPPPGRENSRLRIAL
jgi:hypothetical protein